MNFQELHHVAIITTDYQKTKTFYVDQLGLKIIRENYRPERGDYKIDLQFGTAELEIFVVKDAPKRPNYPEACGLRHLCFKVDDVEATAKELQAKGIATEPIRVDAFTNKKMTFFFDPDGLPLEIHE